MLSRPRDDFEGIRILGRKRLSRGDALELGVLPQFVAHETKAQHDGHSTEPLSEVRLPHTHSRILGEAPFKVPVPPNDLRFCCAT